MGRFWFGVGAWALAGLLCGAGAAYVAVNRGHSAAGPFAVGFALNVIGLAGVMLTLSRKDVLVPSGLVKIPSTATPARCGGCGRENHPAARACSGCGTALTPSAISEADRIRGGV